jgi:hypothetical protein
MIYEMCVFVNKKQSADAGNTVPVLPRCPVLLSRINIGRVDNVINAAVESVP